MHLKRYFLVWQTAASIVHSPSLTLHPTKDCVLYTALKSSAIRGAYGPCVLQSLQESRAKGLQTWTEQQAAAKQVTDPSQADTNDWVSLDCDPQALHSSQVMPESDSPSRSGDGCSVESQTQDDCVDDLQPEDKYPDGSQLEEDYLGDLQPEVFWADESQPEEDGGNDLQPECDWACPNEAQPEDVWADDSRSEDDCANHLQPEDNSADKLQQEGICADESQPEGDHAGFDGDLALQNRSGCGEEEEPVLLDPTPDYGLWEVDVQSELCLSLSSDEEEPE